MPTTQATITDHVSTTFDPPPTTWAHLFHTFRNATAGADLPCRTRAELGLPTDKPVVLTGHQPGFHHLGIAAKAFAAAELAGQTGAHPVWLVVDHDHPVPFPATLDDTAKQTAQHLLTKHTNAPSTPEASANAFLDHLGLADRFIVLPASSLAQTSVFKDLLNAIARDPFTIIKSYNHAALANPDAGVRPLHLSPTAWYAEFPLWRFPTTDINPDARRPLTLDDLDNQPRELDILAPRAIFMTLLCRLAVCDLFIHGLGGHRYEHVTDDWVRAWLGPHAHLAPVVLATADPPASNADALRRADHERRRARWLARSARHNPALLDDDDAQREKARIVARIDAAKQEFGHGSSQAAHLHRQLRAFLQSTAERHAPELRALEQDANATERALERAAATADRTTPTIAQPPSTIADLAEQVRAAFNTPT